MLNRISQTVAYTTLYVATAQQRDHLVLPRPSALLL